MGGQHGVETVPPLLTFFLADGELLAPGSFPNVSRVPGPDLLRQEPQRHPLGGDGSRRMHKQPVAGRMAQRPQALRGRVPRPVAFRRIVDGQHHRDSAQAGVRRVDMTVQDVLGDDVVISKEALGSFEHTPSATRFRQRRCGMLA